MIFFLLKSSTLQIFLLENILSKQNNIQDDSAWAHVLLSLSFFFFFALVRSGRTSPRWTSSAIFSPSFTKYNVRQNLISVFTPFSMVLVWQMVPSAAGMLLVMQRLLLLMHQSSLQTSCVREWKDENKGRREKNKRRGTKQRVRVSIQAHYEDTEADTLFFTLLPAPLQRCL